MILSKKKIVQNDNKFSKQSWPRELPVSTAKAGIEENRTIISKKTIKENQNKLRTLPISNSINAS